MKHSIEDGFLYYAELAKTADYRQLFSSQEIFSLLETLNEEQANYRYAPGKWNIKQVIGHITDHERIMTYRLLRFSRKDTTPLPGYDENLFVDNSRFNELSLQQLTTDFRNVRAAMNSFMDALSGSQLALKGFVWKYEMTIEVFLKATIGHQIHHHNIIRERYLKDRISCDIN